MNSRTLFGTSVKTNFAAEDLSRWTGGIWRGDSPDPVTGFSIDTRTIQAGDLFIAIRGEKIDGHAFVRDAVARGAAAIMIDHDDAAGVLSVPRLLVKDTRKALGDLARGFRQTLRCPMVAVTGSVGKTTVKELLADMLQPLGVTARSKGNWNNDLGLPLSLLAADPETQYGVFEVGMNHPGELDPLCDILMPSLAIVTCVGPVHIENFPGEQGIAIEKSAVYRALKGDGIAILNADDQFAPLMKSYTGANRVVEVSTRAGADYVYRRISGQSGAFEIEERASGETHVLEATLPGLYFVMDVALAAAAARALQVPWEVITHAVRHYQPLSMRWNRQRMHDILVINDAYNANPVSMVAAAEAFLEEPVEGRRWLVLGGMLELGQDEETIHRATGAKIAALGSHFSLVAVGSRGVWLAEGARAAGLPAARIHIMKDHAAAAAALAKSIHGNDAVLFKASRGEAVEKVLELWKNSLNSRGDRAH